MLDRAAAANPEPGSTAPARVVVEIDARAEQLVDARLARRLIALEAGDVDVPPAPGAGTRRRPVLFFRVLGQRNGALRVELWDRGEYLGARVIADVASSTLELRSRRIALAAAQIAQRLRDRRLAEARRLAEQGNADHGAANDPEVDSADLGLRAGVVGALVGPGELWLAGPRLAARARVRGGLRLEIGASWLGGAALFAAGNRARWLELSLSPTFSVALSERLGVDAGLAVGAAAMHVDGARAVDDRVGQADTWSARAAGHLGVQGAFSRGLGWSAAGELGALLRPVVFVDEAGDRQRFAGLWLGVAFALSIDAAH